MLHAGKRLSNLAGCKQGNVAIMTAVAAPLIVLTAAVGLDYGNLTLQKRALQRQTDLASIVAAAKISDYQQALLQHFRMNKLNFALRNGSDLLTLNGTVKFDGATALTSYDGYADVVLGRYTPDPAINPEQRFVAGAQPYDTARVSIHQKSALTFASLLGPGPTLDAVGTSTAYKLASFSVGSRLASIDGGILNGLLGGLLGTRLSLSAMDYEALLNADVDALKLTDRMGLDLGITAGSYKNLLATKITYRQFLASLMKTSGLSPPVATIVGQLQKSLNSTQLNLTLADILELGSLDDKPIGSGSSLLVNASVFDLVSAAAAAANAGKQLSIDLGATVPGLASTQLTIAIGEPPAGTPMLAVGQPGSIVRTAQTRVNLTTSVNGLSAIAGLKVTVPLYIEVADAEAKLSAINCFGGARNNASVDVQAVPGIAEISLGNVDTSAFDNFGTDPRVTKATLVSSSLLTIKGLSHIDSANMSPKTLTFSPSEISSGDVKSVSTADTLTSLVTSLLGNLKLDVNVLAVTFGTPQAAQDALVTTVSVATVPIDKVLYNTLLTLGVKVGEADVRVTGVSCQRPVLVN